MKIKIWLSITLISLIVLATGCKKDGMDMEIVRDCTGTYLRANNGQDFLVCNDAILAPYDAGTKVDVEYDVIEQCYGLIEPVTCELLHVYEDKIDITKVL